MVFDFDDFGCNHVISDQCQSHDCRDALLMLKEANPKFKVTLFAIPGEMTPELLSWAVFNKDWVELAVHGLFHFSNYECEKLTYDEFDLGMKQLGSHVFDGIFAKGFKAPGWQISDDCYRWLKEHGWWVADQSYNNTRRPKELPAYVNDNGNFLSYSPATAEWVAQDAWHGHTWNCVGNGIYETLPQLLDMVKDVEEFKFVSEVLQ